MASEDTGSGEVKVDFRQVDDVVWRGKPAGFAQGVEKYGGGCSVLGEWVREGRVSGGGSRG